MNLAEVRFGQISTRNSPPRRTCSIPIRGYIPRYPRFFQFIYQHCNLYSQPSICLFFITFQINFSFKLIQALFFIQNSKLFLKIAPVDKNIVKIKRIKLQLTIFDQFNLSIEGIEKIAVPLPEP